MSFSLIAFAMLVLVCAFAAWWWLPKWSVQKLRQEIPDAKARADVEDNFRKTIGQLLGGAAVILGAGLAYLQTQQTLQAQSIQAHAALRAQDEQSVRTIISQQIAKGFELLGDKDLIKRIGGIYALEGVMDTPEQYHPYHQSVIDGVSAFVRISTGSGTNETPLALAADVEAALTVIKRKAGTVKIVLAKAQIPNVILSDSHLVSADLNGINLSNAELLQVDLSGGAVLANANLSNAKMYGADLSYANLNRATLISTQLISAKLINASLIEANLSNADLNNADLKDALLKGAILDNADLSSVRNLTQAQLAGACGTHTKLPSEHMKINECRKS